MAFDLFFVRPCPSRPQAESKKKYIGIKYNFLFLLYDVRNKIIRNQIVY